MAPPPLPSPPLPDGMTQLFLLRHGATEHNETQPPRIQGRGSDLGLSERGRRQANEAAERLRGIEIAAVYASTMRRAIETAEIIAQPQNRHVQPLVELIECDVGRWEGRTWAEVERDDTAYYRQFRADPAAHGYLGGENLMQVLARVRPAFERVLATHAGSNVVVVAHNVVNRAYLADLLAMPLAEARERLPQHNGAISLVRRRGAQTRVVMLNSIWHLLAWE